MARVRIELDRPALPDILVVHAGGDDLDKVLIRELMGSMKEDVCWLLHCLPGLFVVWGGSHSEVCVERCMGSTVIGQKEG